MSNDLDEKAGRTSPDDEKGVDRLEDHSAAEYHDLPPDPDVHLSPEQKAALVRLLPSQDPIMSTNISNRTRNSSTSLTGNSSHGSHSST
jgi:hypothetical protein